MGRADVWWTYGGIVGVVKSTVAHVTDRGAVLVSHLFWPAPGSQLPRFHKGATPAPVVCKYVRTRLDPLLTLKRQTPLQTFQIQEGLKCTRKAGSVCVCGEFNPLRPSLPPPQPQLRVIEYAVSSCEVPWPFHVKTKYVCMPYSIMLTVSHFYLTCFTLYKLAPSRFKPEKSKAGLHSLFC